jgi:hypothetical protein
VFRRRNEHGAYQKHPICAVCVVQLLKLSQLEQSVAFVGHVSGVLVCSANNLFKPIVLKALSAINNTEARIF